MGKRIWLNPIRIGVSIGVVVSYATLFVNGFSMPEKVFWGGMVIILDTFILFFEDVSI